MASDLKFVASDFDRANFPGRSLTDVEKEECAVLANARLAEMLKDATVVVCRKDHGLWTCDEHMRFARATHKALLVCVEPIG